MKQLTIEELKELYYGMTNSELCKKLGIGNKTLNRYIKEACIPFKGKGNTRKFTIVKSELNNNNK